MAVNSKHNESTKKKKCAKLQKGGIYYDQRELRNSSLASRLETDSDQESEPCLREQNIEDSSKTSTTDLSTNPSNYELVSERIE